ncbi:MAG TPA: hypothetical protein VEA40_08890 [Ramlibacter sp.]|nr:hypothetical protein [Ramlibacter sp.]
MTLRLLSGLLLAAFGLAAHAKLPAPVLDDAAKAKAAEAAARTAWQAKVDAFQLCRAQDRVAAKYKAAGKGADAKGGLQPVAAKPAAPAASAPQAAASGTPVAAGPAPCLDPGAFAYNPPEQKPLETAGAHSPSGTAASPPNVRPEAAQMTPSKPSVAPGAPAAPAKK